MKSSKDSQYTIRLTTEEKEAIEHYAENSGMKTAAFIRCAALLAVKSNATRDELMLASLPEKKEVKRTGPVARPGNMLEQLSLDVEMLKGAVDELRKKG